MLPMMLLMALPLLGIVLFFVLPPGLAIPLYVLGLILSGITHWAMMRSMRAPVQTGRQGMIGSRGRVLSWQQAGGVVSCHGEVWRARCVTDAPLVPGVEVEVLQLQQGEDMVLLVAPVTNGPSGRGEERARPGER